MCSVPLARAGAACSNIVCGWDHRHVDAVHALCRRTSAVRTVIERFKYTPGHGGWASILGRAVLGWLELHASPDDYGLIVANPTVATPTPIRHTEAILAVARREDWTSAWPWDDPRSPALVKDVVTTASAAPGAKWKAKQAAAEQLWSALRVAHPERVTGASVLVIDDVTTTLLQLRVVAGVLKRAGARRVEGLVLARSV